MLIRLNGGPREVLPDANVLSLIASLKLLPEATAVQLNDEVVPRSAYADTVLNEGDVIELIRFVGGG